MTHFFSSDLWETRVQNDQQEQGYNLRDPQLNLRNLLRIDQISSILKISRFLNLNKVLAKYGQDLRTSIFEDFGVAAH